MSWRRSIRRRSAAEVVAVSACVVLAGVAAVLPWHRSGGVRRTGFELARAADRAGLVTEGWQRLLLVGAFLLPMVAAVAFLAAVAGRPRWTGGVACVAAAVGLASSLVVVRLSGGRQVGPAAAIAAALVAAASGIHVLGRKSPE